MIINYVDIAGEQESVSVSLTGLPSGVQSYVDWIKQESLTNSFSYYGTNADWLMIFPTAIVGTNSRPISDFDFSSAEKINLYNYVRTGTQFELILSLDSFFETDVSEFVLSQTDTITPIANVRPGFSILCPEITGQISNDLASSRYEQYKASVAAENRESPAYRLHAVKVATLDIAPANAIERLESITF